MAASLELAISAIRSGRKEEGRQLLNLLIQQNPNDDKAWLWMSSVVETDEQRARCLYHVLAINPTSEVARKGLQVLGIVVSDSRPVKVPRDSQPIKIPKPTPQAAPQPTSQEERRPFLIDPRAVTDELPFTPTKAPFSDAVQASPAVLAIDVEDPVKGNNGSAKFEAATMAEQSTSAPEKSSLLARLSKSTSPTDTQEMVQPSAAQVEQLQDPSKPVSVVTTPDAQELGPKPDSQPVPVVDSVDTRLTDTQELVGSPQPSEHPSKPVPVVSMTDTQELMASIPGPAAPLQHPSEPVSVVRSVPARHPSEPIPVQTSPPNQPIPLPGQLPASSAASFGPTGQPFNQPLQALPPQQQLFGGPTPAQIPNDTRPSQPTPVVAYPDPNMGAVQGGANVYYPPAQQMPGPHASTTIGMPAPQPMQPLHPSQPVSSIHSNTTMGMPVPAPGGYLQHPSEPVPVIHSSGTLGMAPYGQPQSPQNMALHSSATMMMPTMSEAEARARLATGPALPTANATAMALQSASNQPFPMGNVSPVAYNAYDMGDEEEEGDEVNILAVIIFGTLSVTALGGLGMLILLVFTTPAV